MGSNPAGDISLFKELSGFIAGALLSRVKRRVAKPKPVTQAVGRVTQKKYSQRLKTKPPQQDRGGLAGSVIGVLSDFRALSHMRCLIDTRRFIDLAKLRAVLVQCVLDRQ